MKLNIEMNEMEARVTANALTTEIGRLRRTKQVAATNVAWITDLITVRERIERELHAAEFGPPRVGDVVSFRGSNYHVRETGEVVLKIAAGRTDSGADVPASECRVVFMGK
jgi:hypothetical protein